MIKEPVLTFLTHPSDFIQGDKKYVFMARIEKCNEYVYIKIYISDYETKEYFISEYLQETLSSAYALVRAMSDVIGSFEPKILYIDENYSEELVQKWVSLWLNDSCGNQLENENL